VGDPDDFQPNFFRDFYLPPDFMLDLLSTKTFQFECVFEPSEFEGINLLADAPRQSVNEIVNNGSVWHEREGDLTKINESGFSGLADSFSSYLPDSEFSDYSDAVAQWPCGINYIRAFQVIDEDDEDIITDYSIGFFLTGRPLIQRSVDFLDENFWHSASIGGAIASVTQIFSSFSVSSSHADINGIRFGTPAIGFPTVKISSLEYY
jgi:hypothetical protein